MNRTTSLSQGTVIAPEKSLVKFPVQRETDGIKISRGFINVKKNCRQIKKNIKQLAGEFPDFNLKIFYLGLFNQKKGWQNDPE